MQWAALESMVGLSSSGTNSAMSESLDTSQSHWTSLYLCLRLVDEWALQLLFHCSHSGNGEYQGFILLWLLSPEYQVWDLSYALFLNILPVVDSGWLFWTGLVVVVFWAQSNVQSSGSRCRSTSQKCCGIFYSILKWVCEARRKWVSHLSSHGWALGSLSKSCLRAVAFEVPSSCQALTSR